MINNAEGATYYVCHYLCKSEPDELKSALGNLLTDILTHDPATSLYQRLWKIGTWILRHRRLSAQEAAFRLNSLQLIQGSRTTVYINSRPTNQRYKMLKPMSEIAELNGTSEDIFHTNPLDYYRAGPSNLEYTSLYHFAPWFQRCSKPSCAPNARRTDRIFI